MENLVKEDVLLALTEFGRKGCDSSIPRLLEDYLRFVAATGDTIFPWSFIKALVRRKIEQVLCDFLIISSPDSVPPSPNVDPFKYAIMREKILEALEYFTQAPFTIQRLCEVMVDPKKYYKRIDKLMRAIEKNLLVTTTVDPRRPDSPNGDSCADQAGGVANGYDDRANGHPPSGFRATTGLLEGGQFNPATRSAGSGNDEPMDVTEPTAQQPHAILDCGGVEPMEGCEDEGSEDIDVDQDHSQPADTSNHSRSGETPPTIATPPLSTGQGQLDNNNSLASGISAIVSPVQESSEAGGSSQENLMHIQQQMREQQRQMMVSFGGTTTAAAGGNKGEGSGTGSGAGSGAESGVIASSATGSSSGQTRPSAALNGEDSCSDVEGESEQDMMLIMMRGSRESAQDNELEQQVPQFGSCESGESGGLSPVQFQSVSSQSSQDTKKEGQASAISSTATTSTGSETASTPDLQNGQNRVDQSSLVGSSQQRTDESTGDFRSQSSEAKATSDDHDESGQGSPQAGGSEAVASSAVKSDDSEGNDHTTDHTQEESIGQSSELASASRSERTTGGLGADRGAGEQTELDTTGSPSGNEAAAKE